MGDKRKRYPFGVLSVSGDRNFWNGHLVATLDVPAINMTYPDSSLVISTGVWIRFWGSG